MNERTERGRGPTIPRWGDTRLTGDARTPNRDSDIWAIYARCCLGQALDFSARAALNDDPDIEQLEEDYVQPARAAPGGTARR